MDEDRLRAWFEAQRRLLEEGYLRSDDPIRQSGFSGGPDRWRLERGPILAAIEEDGEFVDVGCANGYLLECLVAWAEERGRALIPYGVDFSETLIDLAKRRMPQHASNFYVANAWYWMPPRRWRYVYALLDSVPEAMMGRYARRLFDRYAEPGGRLIAGYYGSRSRAVPPIDVGALLEAHGFRVAGTAEGGTPVVTRFAWVDKP
ncbi:MAG: SAM-dependent methyltransferase [Euryarchaeota archaeon]|nr:SAM-dependent methyltransferase [Euryarchaeota archaeon]